MLFPVFVKEFPRFMALLLCCWDVDDRGIVSSYSKTVILAIAGCKSTSLDRYSVLARFREIRSFRELLWICIWRRCKPSRDTRYVCWFCKTLGWYKRLAGSSSINLVVISPAEGIVIGDSSIGGWSRCTFNEHTSWIARLNLATVLESDGTGTQSAMMPAKFAGGMTGVPGLWITSITGKI
jgi:hypothetical protein